MPGGRFNLAQTASVLCRACNLRGQTVWKVEVEVFDLTGHPKAKRGHGWSHPEGRQDEKTKIYYRVGVPPIHRQKQQHGRAGGGFEKAKK